MAIYGDEPSASFDVDNHVDLRRHLGCELTGAGLLRWLATVYAMYVCCSVFTEQGRDGLKGNQSFQNNG